MVAIKMRLREIQQNPNLLRFALNWKAKEGEAGPSNVITD